MKLPGCNGSVPLKSMRIFPPPTSIVAESRVPSSSVSMAVCRPGSMLSMRRAMAAFGVEAGASPATLDQAQAAAAAVSVSPRGRPRRASVRAAAAASPSGYPVPPGRDGPYTDRSTTPPIGAAARPRRRRAPSALPAGIGRPRRRPARRASRRRALRSRRTAPLRRWLLGPRTPCLDYTRARWRRATAGAAYGRSVLLWWTAHRGCSELRRPRRRT